HAIVGGGLPVAVGLALAEKRMGRAGIVACFFGDGAVAEGEFHESANLAALWGLPVLFCCENNLYAMGTALARSESETNLAIKAASYELPAWTVDGMDALAVDEAARRAISYARGGGACFLELRTYRFRAHSMYDPELYREKSEVELWKLRDPIAALEASLRAAALFDDGARDALERKIADELADAVAFAEAAPLEPVEDLERHVLAEGAP
ncbi:MAG TPA: thiamine pyrophosphate-dependent enzyme, partial [Myxococcota bacterium]|nr:thiamine pyrophosphate-dependent enzyme [Myxococcota bacterium]